MTHTDINEHIIGSISDIGINTVSLEIRKSKIGAVLVVMNIVGIRELSRERIVLLSHSGNVVIVGDRLVLSVFEDKSVEIVGRIEGVELKYGKNR